MPTKLKLKIKDQIELRCKLDELYETATQEQIARWAINLAIHVLELAAPEFLENAVVVNGFWMSKQWQEGKVRIHDVRQASFKIHQLAKACEDEKMRIALRVVGQAVATGHMKEHGMVASDYAIKCINLTFPNRKEAVIDERMWQIQELKMGLK